MLTFYRHFSRFMLEKNIAVVSISFPVTSFAGGRVRFCVSAAHTREMLDRVNFYFLVVIKLFAKFIFNLTLTSNIGARGL